MNERHLDVCSTCGQKIPFTNERARELKVCRLCGEKDSPRKRDDGSVNSFVYDYGKEYAHDSCLRKEKGLPDEHCPKCGQEIGHWGGCEGVKEEERLKSGIYQWGSVDGLGCIEGIAFIHDSGAVHIYFRDTRLSVVYSSVTEARSFCGKFGKKIQ